MIVLSHPTSGHEVRTDEASADFWRGAGYQDVKEKAPAKRAASKKSSSIKK